MCIISYMKKNNYFENINSNFDRYYLFEIVLLIAAIIAIVKRQSFKGVEFILLWLVLAPIPAALTKGSGYAANRAAVLMPAIQILSAYGLVYLQGVLKTKFRNFL